MGTILQEPFSEVHDVVFKIVPKSHGGFLCKVVKKLSLRVCPWMRILGYSEKGKSGLRGARWGPHGWGAVNGKQCILAGMFVRQTQIFFSLSNALWRGHIPSLKAVP